MSDQFIFWDLETTGRNDKYDQITQVGAVLTDKNFEVKDKLEIHSKLREGKWFEPGALITTGVDPINLFKNKFVSFAILLNKFINGDYSLPKTILHIKSQLLFPIIGICFLGNLLILLNYFLPLKSPVVGVILFLLVSYFLSSSSSDNLQTDTESSLGFRYFSEDMDRLKYLN